MWIETNYQVRKDSPDIKKVKSRNFIDQVISNRFCEQTKLLLHTVVVQSRSCVWLFGTHELQHTRLPSPSPSPEVCSNSCPLCWWGHPTISSSVILFSSCLQSFPASGSFPRRRLFASGVQRIRAWASASVFPMNIQSWFPLGLTGVISLLSKGL